MDDEPVTVISSFEAQLLARIGTAGLEERLRQASSDAGVRALSGLNDLVEACLQAGQALEHLAKAVVFASEPEALTNKRKAKSAAFLTGLGHPEVRHLGQVYTVPGREAVVEAFGRLGLGEPDEEDLKEAFDARNAAAHMAFADQWTALGSVGAALRLVDQLLAGEGTTTSAWLQDDELATLFELVVALPRGTDSWTRSNMARLHAQLWNARREVDRLRERLPHNVWLSMATEPKDPDWREERELRTRPAGDHLAWYVVLWEEDDAQDNDDPEHLSDEVARLGGLDCGLCGLDLANDDVWALGLSEVVGWRQVER